jgi:hypothetical protein
VQALAAPWAEKLGALGQSLYLAMLFAPALVLGLASRERRHVAEAPTRRGVLAIAGIIVVWVALQVVVAVGSPRAMDAVDGWRGIVGLARFSANGQNLLTDLWDPELPGLGALPLFFFGEPFFRLGFLPLGLPAAQVLHILWLALSAAGLGVLARTLVGLGVATIAVTFLLFAPYALYMAVLPGPFLMGPLYTVALLLAFTAAVRRRSEAGLAALGALGGIVLSYPGMVPVAGLLGVVTLWCLRRDWRQCWIGLAAGAAVLAAAVVPALPKVLTPNRMGQHLGAHGAATLLEAALLGQAPADTFARARAVMVPRPLEIVGAALVEPFANPRTHIRLWGDAIFEPLGAVLLAVGLVSALRMARHSGGARFLLVLYLVALAPAFVSPVDRVDIVHAIALPVPAALLAGVGFMVLRDRWTISRAGHAALVAVATAAMAAGGMLLFEVVNPRILSASSAGVMFRVLRPDDAPRVVVLDYPPGYNVDVRWLFTGVMTAYGGAVPVGYLPYGGGPLPAGELAAEHKTILFWSPGIEADLRIGDAVCGAWPDATLYDLTDESGLGRTHAAVVAGATWTPSAPPQRWRRRACGEPGAS